MEKEIAQNLINVDYEYEDMQVTGVIGKPEIARSTRTNQLFFVNKRYIKDKTLTSAADQAFKGIVGIGKKRIFSFKFRHRFKKS